MFSLHLKLPNRSVCVFFGVTVEGGGGGGGLFCLTNLFGPLSCFSLATGLKGDNYFALFSLMYSFFQQNKNKLKTAIGMGRSPSLGGYNCHTRPLLWRFYG